MGDPLAMTIPVGKIGYYTANSFTLELLTEGIKCLLLWCYYFYVCLTKILLLLLLLLLLYW